MDQIEADIRRLFGSLPTSQKAAVLAKLQHELADELTRAAQMLAELQSMGFAPNSANKSIRSADRRHHPAPKYRSRSNPSLTWSGRGNTARWLLDEIAATGLKLEDFRIDE